MVTVTPEELRQLAGKLHPARFACGRASRPELKKLHRMLLLDPRKSSDFDLFCQRFVNIEHFRNEKIDDPAAAYPDPKPRLPQP